MAKIRAIFFDQDNTIVNTSVVSTGCYYDAIKYIAEKTRYSADEIYNAWLEILEVVKKLPDPKQRFFDYSLSLVFDKMGIPSDLLSIAVNMEYDLLEKRIELNPGVSEFMQLKNGLLKILFTEDNHLGSDMKVRKFNLKFDLIVTSDEIGVMKPDIKYLEYAWAKFGLKPEECIYVGDNWEKDCRLGQDRGGIGVVFGKKDARANFQISDMMELGQIIDTLNK
ncbi:HAD family hydrolase [Candidatus Dojkabacteria bacterium]|nr:HAD family hydrolase [Candidatus Dojkabacteria bacterium]